MRTCHLRNTFCTRHPKEVSVTTFLSPTFGKEIRSHTMVIPVRSRTAMGRSSPTKKHVPRLLQLSAPQSILKSVTIPKEGGHVRSLNRESACPWNSETLEVGWMGFVLWTPIQLRPCKPRKNRRRWHQFTINNRLRPCKPRKSRRRWYHFTINNRLRPCKPRKSRRRWYQFTINNRLRPCKPRKSRRRCKPRKSRRRWYQFTIKPSSSTM